MTELNICSYNVRNDNIVGGFSKVKIETVYKDLLSNYKIDVLATQEMVSSTLQILKSTLTNYHILGSYRYGKNFIIKRIKSLEKYNEGNNIITRLNVITEKTTELPWLPRNIKELYTGAFKYHSIMPRIMTEVILEIPDYGKVRFINTHLSHHLRGIVNLQLKKLRTKIRNSTIPTVLTGDFNLGIYDKTFKKFVEDLKILGMQRVEINQRTFKKSKHNEPIDHIFIPNNWIIKDKKIIDEKYLDNYSDHYPIIITVIPSN